MTKFKIFLWAAAVCIIIGGAIAAIVILVVDNENKNANKPPSPPPPPFPPGYRFPPPPPPSSKPPPPPPKPSPDTPPFPAPTGYEWVFYDEFNVDGKPNPKKWGYDIGTGDTGWGNNEAQYYTNSPSNSKVEDGNLVITALREQYQYMQYTSARLTTKGKASFYPGPGSKYSEITIEASIKAPGPTPAMGLWGAFWMLPEDNKYGAWPSSGEIDIFEIINGMTGMLQGVQFGPPGNTNPGENEKYMITTAISSGTYSDTYHTYKVGWTPEAMTFYIDGTAVLQAVPRADNPQGWFTPKSNNPAAPFDGPFYLIANIAVGGTFPNGGYSAKYPDQNTPFPNNMYIDYIRVLGKTA